MSVPASVERCAERRGQAESHLPDRWALHAARYTCRVTNPFSPPLARWDGLHVVVSLPLLERYLADLLQRLPQLQQLQLGGEGDTLRVRGTVVWKHLSASLQLELGEFRLKHRILGFRVRRIRTLGSVRLPRAALEAVLERLDHVTVLRGEGIVIVNLQEWIPPEVSLSVLTMQVSGSSLHLWLGPGSVAVPSGRVSALTAGSNPSLAP